MCSYYSKNEILFNEIRFVRCVCVCAHKLIRFAEWCACACVRVCECSRERSGDAISGKSEPIQRQTSKMTSTANIEYWAWTSCRWDIARRRMTRSCSTKWNPIFPIILLSGCLRACVCRLQVLKLVKTSRDNSELSHCFSMNWYIRNSHRQKKWLNCRRNVSRLCCFCNARCYLSIW